MWTLLSDEEQASLVQGIRDGDAAAEQTFVRLFGERIRVMMTIRTGDSEAARELTQDVLFAAWRGIRENRLQDPARLAAFVHGTARNVMNNFIRARAGEPPLDSLTDEAARHSARAADPEHDRRALVAAALRHLTAADRQVLLLTLAHGLTPREIARRLGLGVEVVRARKSRALKRAIEAIAELSRIRSTDH
jgi:RNA polymerase sigma factor (sigma-70 family)